MKKLNRIIQLSLAVLVLIAFSANSNQAFAQNLVYGQKYSLKNNWSNHQSYLDINGTGCQTNLYCVSTTKTSSRVAGSGTWMILSASGKKAGEPVVAGDLIILQNTYNGNGGYLGTRGYKKDFDCAGDLCVSTYKEKDLAGSSTWQIQGDVKANGAVTLAGQWNYATAGFLHIAGHHAAGGYNVAASKDVHTQNKTWYLIPSK